MEFAQDGARVDVVEINAAVLDPAQRFFDLKPEKMNIHIADGREYVHRADRRYDANILDTFLGDSPPSHMMTREAFRDMKALLKPDGVLVINSFGSLEPGEDFCTRALTKTLRASFARVRIHSAGNLNVFFVATDRSNLVVAPQPSLTHVLPALRPAVQKAFANVTEYEGNAGMILTDDYNPLEFYDAKHREQYRRRLAQWFARALRTEDE
jgi:spermidine synthase